MGAIANIFKQYFPAYQARFGNAIPSEHNKVANAILKCKTGAYGVSLFQCADCGEMHTLVNGCGNRHCPGCQQHKNFSWVDKQKEKLLPVTYFMVTFTVPAEVREFIRSNQKICYSSMFKAASATLKLMLKDNKRYGIEQPGFFGVLHTWGRDLNYHPHIHFIVPGGGLKKGGAWQNTRSDFLIFGKAAAKIFRAKFYDEMQNAGHKEKMTSYRPNGWNVNVKAMGNGVKVLDYLAPYVFKVAISDNKIISWKNGKVTFKYRKTGTNRLRTMTLDAMEFIRRFLQHVLPHGFTKVRHYGFLSANALIDIAKLRKLINKLNKTTVILPENKPNQGKMTCSCGCQVLNFVIYLWQPVRLAPG